MLGVKMCENQIDDDFVVYNDEIVDPDDSLNPLQLLSKLLEGLEKLSRLLSKLADLLEQALNIFSSEDCRVTVMTLVVLFVLSLMVTVILFLDIVRLLAVLGTAAVFSPKWWWGLASSSSTIQAEQFQQKKIPKIVVAALNVWTRAPTSERVAHRLICESQRVDKPVMETKLQQELDAAVVSKDLDE